MKRRIFFLGFLSVLTVSMTSYGTFAPDVIVDAQGKTALMRAIAAGEGIDSVQQLMQPMAINWQDSNGRTALMYAANWLRFDVIEKLQQAGADTEIVDNQGHDAFYYALNRSPYVKREDMKDAQLFDFGIDGGEYDRGGCASWCRTSAFCKESEPFCIGSQCGFSCKVVTKRVHECGDSCKEVPSFGHEQEFGVYWFVHAHKGWLATRGSEPLAF